MSFNPKPSFNPSINPSFNPSVSQKCEPKNGNELILKENKDKLFGKKIKGTVVEVYDGDTCNIVLKIDGTDYNFTCRLKGIDTPEINPSKYKLEKDRVLEIKNAIKARNELLYLICSDEACKKLQKKYEVNNFLKKNKYEVTVECFSADYYGRLLVYLYGKDLTKSFNDILVKNGVAHEYVNGKKPWEFKK